MVLLLFTIALLGAAGYQVLRSEALQSQQFAEVEQALAVADAGLRWFIGNQRGPVPDSATYTINGGVAFVTTRKVAVLAPEEDLYLVSAEGTYTDPRFPQVPARRTVSQYATYRKVPLRYLAPLMTTAPTIQVRGNALVSGDDQAVAGECAGSPRGPLAGAVARGSVVVVGGGVVSGSPTSITPAPFAAVVDTVALEWGVYSDPAFPVDYDGTWPDFSSLPADSFPVIRVNGDLTANSARWGRGVLIVTGTLRIPDFSFWTWHGIVMAGDIADVGEWGWFEVFGTLVGGMGSAMKPLRLERGTIYAHSCNVRSAGLSLAHLTMVENSWWESF